MMDPSLISAVFLSVALAGAAVEMPAEGIYESPAAWTPQGRIDELLSDRWKQRGIQPANLCSDGVFVRRVYLDVIGTLPTAREARQSPNSVSATAGTCCTSSTRWGGSCRATRASRL